MKRFAPTAIALLVLIGSARAIDVPVMKEGFWKLHMVTSTPGDKPDDTTYYLCRDHAYDLKVKAIADNAMKSCTNLSDTTSGGKRYLNMTCTAGGSKITSKAVITSTGDSYYRTETSSTFSPPLGGESASNMVQEQTWVGACPAGMSPGDRKMSDGSIQHHR
jgi:hypothetical protein